LVVVVVVKLDSNCW